MKRRKNVKSNSKERLNLILFIFLCLVCFGIFTNFGVGKKYTSTYEIEVNSSDTIWDIASDICKKNSDLNIQNVVLEIKSINNLNTSDIYVGQTLSLPIY